MKKTSLLLGLVPLALSIAACTGPANQPGNSQGSGSDDSSLPGQSTDDSEDSGIHDTDDDTSGTTALEKSFGTYENYAANYESLINAKLGHIKYTTSNGYGVLPSTTLHSEVTSSETESLKVVTGTKNGRDYSLTNYVGLVDNTLYSVEYDGGVTSSAMRYMIVEGNPSAADQLTRQDATDMLQNGDGVCNIASTVDAMTVQMDYIRDGEVPTKYEFEMGADGSASIICKTMRAGSYFAEIRTAEIELDAEGHVTEAFFKKELYTGDHWDPETQTIEGNPTTFYSSSVSEIEYEASTAGITFDVEPYFTTSITGLQYGLYDNGSWRSTAYKNDRIFLRELDFAGEKSEVTVTPSTAIDLDNLLFMSCEDPTAIVCTGERYAETVKPGTWKVYLGNSFNPQLVELSITVSNATNPDA